MDPFFYEKRFSESSAKSLKIPAPSTKHKKRGGLGLAPGSWVLSLGFRGLVPDAQKASTTVSWASPVQEHLVLKLGGFLPENS